jgi:hypothetical protein
MQNIERTGPFDVAQGRLSRQRRFALLRANSQQKGAACGCAFEKFLYIQNSKLAKITCIQQVICLL